MVYRWQCRHCEFTVWSAGREQTEQRVQSHLVNHYRDNVTQDDFRVQWTCPYCDQEGSGHESAETIERYKEHLFEHVEPLMESGVHVADDISGTGNVLVLSTKESAADNARVHFLAPSDIAVVVTANPARRIRLLRDDLSNWPAWTVLLTTKDDPLEGVSGVDLSSLPLEIVQIDKRLGLSGLGETISRVIEEQGDTEGKISFEFDILSELIEKFDLQTVFKFLHVLTARLEDADALSHFYANPDARSESSLNVLDQLFDVRITSTDEGFVSKPRPSMD